MKKKKGLSVEEKKERMLKQFLTTLDVYNYKEIEKFSIKAGISILISISNSKGHSRFVIG